MSGLPDFISHFTHFDAQLPPPYKFDDVSARIFALAANKDRLQSLCDKRINAVAEAAGKSFLVKPVSSVVMMEILQYGKMFSRYKGAENSGYSRQNELFLAIPVALYKDASDAKNDIPQSVGIFVPFLFVDNDWSLISGREIFGLQKLLGRFELPDDPSKLSPIIIKAQVLDPYAPDSMAEFRSIVAIPTEDTETPRIDGSRKLWPFGPIDDFYNIHREDAPFPVSDRVRRSLDLVAGIEVDSIALRQFREGGNPDKASYRSLLTAEMKLDHFDSATIVGNPPIRFPGAATAPYKGYTSLNLVEELGLTLADQSGLVKPVFSMLFEGDFVFDIRETLVTQCGQNLWSKDPAMSCGDIIGAGVKEAGSLVKKQARVAKSLMKRMARAELDPEGYARDIEKGCRNALRYYKSVCRLTKAGVRHMLPD